jgi:hypothetical protein
LHRRLVLPQSSLWPVSAIEIVTIPHTRSARERATRHCHSEQPLGLLPVVVVKHGYHGQTDQRLRDLADVGMVQRGDGMGFPLESFTELRGGNLDRHVALQPGIMRFVDLSHAARADGCYDFVGAEFVACYDGERGISQSVTCSGNAGV